MPDGMDIDRPGSVAPRDPRLANRQPRPTRPASVPSRVQSPLWSTPPRPNPHGDEIIQSLQGLADLVRTSVAKERRLLEKGKLLKKKEKTDGLLKRARANAGFPATIEQFQQTSEDEKQELRRLDEEIQHDQSGCSQLEKTLKSSLVSVFSRDLSNREERITKLEKGFDEKLSKQQNEFDQKLAQYRHELERRMTKEFDQAKAAAADAEKRTTQASTLNQTLTASVSKLHDRVETLEISVAKHSSPDRKSPSFSGSQPDGVNQLRANVDALKQQAAKLDSDVKPLALFKSRCLEMFDGLNKECAKQGDVEDLKRRVNDFNTSLESLSPQKTGSDQVGAEVVAKLNDVEKRLHTLEESSASVDVSRLSENLGQIQAVQDMQDDFQKSEFENVQKSLSEQTEELKSLKDGHGQVLDELVNIKRTGSATTQDVARLAATVDTAQRRLETVGVGLHSLETRYNNLSTEPMVKNMVATMQEMYPSTGQLAGQLAAVRTDAAKAIQAVNERAGQLFNTQKEQAEHFQQMSARIDEVNHLKQSLLHLRHSFDELQNNVRVQNIDLVQRKLDTLGKRVDEDEQKVEQLRSRETADTETIRKLKEERGGLREELEKLKRQAINLVDEIDEAKASNAANIDQIKAQASEIKALNDRVTQAEPARTEDIECRIQLLENSTAENGHELREEINQLKRAVGSRHSSLKREQHSNPSDSHGSPRPSALGTVDPRHAEASPAQALQESKKKKKRRRTSNATDDMASAQGSSSPATYTTEGLSQREPSEKKKKKKLKTQDGAGTVR